MRKTRSMQFKLLHIIVTAIIFISLLVGGISIFEFDDYIQSLSDDMIDTVCEKEALRINSMLREMENSVHVMASYVLDFYDTKAASSSICALFTSSVRSALVS